MPAIMISGNELPKSYTPSEHEADVLARWLAAGVFHATPPTDEQSPRYSLLIPPPNVTAALHLGHAFNNTLQDVLTRHHRMCGHTTLWMPGTDHAGISTQTVVEKRLLIEEGRKRTDFERDDFVARVQAWKDEYEQTITEQLQALGASCDYDRQRFTMDEWCAQAVREAFYQLYRDGLIYRGKRLVNWDPVTQTALADDEVDMEEVDGSFWYLRYPIVRTEGDAWVETGDHVTVATTRPETMLGDTAVAVNPDDPERARHIGAHVRLPIVGRIIPVIGDDYVVRPDPESDDTKARFASGYLKVTPAHDPNDWDIGLRHELEAINVMAPDGSISTSHGWDDASDECTPFVGLSREDARAAIVDWFKDNNLLAEVRPYSHSVGHSYRSHVPVEPYLSDQWYVRVTDDRLVGEAQRALADDQFEGERPVRVHGDAAHDQDGALRFHPPRYARTFQSWHDNLRDWCISRQLWWGHRITVWTLDVSVDATRAAALHVMPEEERERAISELAALPELHAARQSDRAAFHAPEYVEDVGRYRYLVCVRDPEGADADLVQSLERAGATQDPDVLDTWFSSGLWPLSTMGWPTPESWPDAAGLLEHFNPTSVLSTGRDIITLWVSRMVMFNRYFNNGALPFRDVYIHALIQDGHGQKMSKSLGNGVDPRDIIHSHGCDAMRFTLTKMATTTQDVRLPVDTISPFSETVFKPAEEKTPAGHVVASPVQTCPDTGRTMVSGYGAASGKAAVSDDHPLARNTSSKFDEGRNFCTKLWNVTRFALHILSDAAPADPNVAQSDWSLADRWILSRLDHCINACNNAIASYHFNALADALYDFTWREFCDWYVEVVKPTARDNRAQQQVIRTILNALLRLLHPVCPFVTETIWPAVRNVGSAGVEGLSLADSELLCVAQWPTPSTSLHDADAEAIVDRAQQLSTTINRIRSENKVHDRRRITLHAGPAVMALVKACDHMIETMSGIESVVEWSDERPSGAVAAAFEGEELLLSGLLDAVDVESERIRLQRLIEEKSAAADNFSKRLANEGYVRGAPPHLVEETRSMLAQAEADRDAARKALEALDS